MYTLIIALIIFCAILLVIVVLAQNSKGGGLSSQFGGAGASNMFGVKKTGDFLEKTTWVLIALIMALSVATNFTAPKGEDTNTILDAAGEQTPALNTQQPAQEETETTDSIK